MKNIILTSVLRSIGVVLLLLSVSLTTAADTPVRRTCPSSHIPRRGQSVTRQAAARQATSYIGDKRQLVILVSFPDKQFKADDPLALWDDIFNQEGYTQAPFVGSVHDYFFDQSYGKLNLTFDLHIAEADSSYTYYGGKDRDGNDEKVGELIAEVVRKMEAEVSDWSVYDWNGDGFIDQVFVLYAGLGQNDGGAANTIWPHQWALTDQHVRAVTVGGEYKVDNYGCFAELDMYDSYGSFGVLCHEYGHCLGLPDFYNGSSRIVADWDVMDYGLYNGDGYCPPAYSAHERMVLGWLDITELSEPASISGMKAITEAEQAYLIRNDAYSDEYYIVENRQKVGWDAALPGSGVLIFHVDYNESSWLYGTPNSTLRKRYTIFAANNKTTFSASSEWAYPYLSNDSLTNLSAPASTLLHAQEDGTKLMSKPITNIRITDGLASFDFMGGVPDPSGVRALTLDLDTPEAVFDLRGRYVGTSLEALPRGLYLVRYANGECRKMVR